MNDVYAVVHITRGHFYCTRHRADVGEFRAYFDARTNDLVCEACRKKAARDDWWAKLRSARR